MREELALAGGYASAGLGPLAAVTVLTPLRDQPLSKGVVVLILVVIITVAAVLAGPFAGAAATLTASLSYDFLFMQPYRELKFGSFAELWPVVLLLAFGVTIVVIVRRRWQRPGSDATPTTLPRPNSSGHVQRVALLIAHGVDVRDLIGAVQAELTGLLFARSCRFDTGHDASSRPRIERDGTVSGGGGELDFPPNDLELPVRLGRHNLGRFVIEPTPGVAVPLDRRIVAVILTDHLAAALASGKPTVPPRI